MVEKELAEVEQDLGDSKKVLRAAKRKKKAKEASGDNLEKDNAKRMLKTIREGVELVEQRWDDVKKRVSVTEKR
jgi:hypothetical protein